LDNRVGTCIGFILPSIFWIADSHIWASIFEGALLATKNGETNAELTSIAKKENPRISKVIVKDIDRKSAYVNSVTNSIILTRRLLETLTHEETLAVLYHEIGHGSFYTLPIRILRLVFIIPAFLFVYFVSCFFVYGVINFLLSFLDRSIMNTHARAG
jgi:hypothetical protein